MKEYIVKIDGLIIGAVELTPEEVKAINQEQDIIIIEVNK